MRSWLLFAIAALLVSRPLYPSESAATHGDGLSAVVLWIALAAFWLLGAVGRHKHSPPSLGEGSGVKAASRFPLRFRWIDAAVLILVVCYGASTLWAVGHGTPRPALNVFWEWVALGLCFLLARQLIETPREARAMAAVMISLAVALSVYGICQRKYELPASLEKYRADPDRALRDAGLWYPPDSPQRKLFEDRLAGDEPMATFALTNSLAGFLAPWLVVLAGIACSDLRNRKRTLGTIVLVAPIALCLFFTHSRSGCVAALLGIALVWPVVRGKGWKIPLAILLLATALVGVAAALGKIDRETAVKSFGYRLQYWRSSIEMIADHPWLGCGPGNFQAEYTRYKLPEASEEIADPHNFLLEIWTNAGTPAALAMLAVLGCFAWNVVGGRGPVTSGQLEERANPQIKNSRSPASNFPPNDCWLFVLAGGAAGFLLSLPLGMLGEAPPGAIAVRLGPFVKIPLATAVLIGLPTAAAAVALLFGWIRDGRLPRLLPALAVAVMLVNLLAAGGISLSGVAGSFWLLMVLGLQSEPPRLVRSIWGWAALVAMAALAVACYYSAYSPVLECQAHLQAAERHPSHAEKHLRAAAATDPWAAEPRRRLAAINLEAWMQFPQKETYLRFERAAANFARRAPNASQTWENIGDWYALAAAKTDRAGNRYAPDAVKKMLDAYRRSVELYPNSAPNRAKLADAYLASGEREAYRREAEAALRLDEATPHADKKLPESTRERFEAAVDK
ncbi:MAG: O-antigen ligase family protein [Pirellulales bacterium]|nr:O-antigen ligase family protein [Pirellulales bacterium]